MMHHYLFSGDVRRRIAPTTWALSLLSLFLSLPLFFSLPCDALLVANTTTIDTPAVDAVADFNCRSLSGGEICDRPI